MWVPGRRRGSGLAASRAAAASGGRVPQALTSHFVALAALMLCHLGASHGQYTLPVPQSLPSEEAYAQIAAANPWIPLNVTQGSQAIAKCQSLAFIIDSIQNVFYGNANIAKKCNSTRASRVVAKMCVGKSVCGFDVNKKTMGEVKGCGGATKHLFLTFRCAAKKKSSPAGKVAPAKNLPASPSGKTAPKTKAPASKAKAPSPKPKSPAPKAKAPSPKPKPKPKSPAPKVKSPSLKAKSPAPAPKAKVPSPKAKAPAPAPKTKSPAPKAKAPAPAPKAKAPTPKAKAPSPKANASPTKLKSPAPKAKVPSPKAKAPTPKAKVQPRKAPSPKANGPAPLPKAPSPKLKPPAPNPKASPPKAMSPSPRPQQAQRVQNPLDGNIQFSQLWGKAGELWNSAGRLTDWSYAGYLAGERGPPQYNVVFNVKEYGARGDGVTDDTDAIMKAVQAASNESAVMGTSPCPVSWDPARRCKIQHKGFLNEGRNGTVVFLPAGKYRITQAIEILQSNVVLRGAGIDRTVLYFPKGLKEIYNNTFDGQEVSWATTGGFLLLQGNNPSSRTMNKQLSRITGNANKGSRRLQVETTAGMEVGKWVRIYALDHFSGTSSARKLQVQAPEGGRAAGGHASRRKLAKAPGNRGVGTLPLTPAMQAEAEWGLLMAHLDAPDGAEDWVGSAAAPGSLDAYLYGDMPFVDSGTDNYIGNDHIRLPSRVSAIGEGWIELERPLPYDLRTDWQPYVYNFEPSVQHSGFEGFTMQFEWVEYPEHWTVAGMNGISISSAANCWVRNVRFVNADNAVKLSKADFVTVVGVTVDVSAPRWTAETEPANGHHALWVSSTGDCIFKEFDIQAMYMHDISVDVYAETTVFSAGKGTNINIDCHRAGPHSHLFTDIDLGSGTRAFKSGGSKLRGEHSGANNTWWNVRPSAEGKVLPLPACDFGPLLNFIGNYGPPVAAKEEEEEEKGVGGESLPVNATVQAELGTAAQVAAASDPTSYQLFPPWCPGRKWWAEIVRPGATLRPPNLYEAMLARRRRSG